MSSQSLMKTTHISRQMAFWEESKITLFENRTVIQNKNLDVLLMIKCRVVLVSKEGTLLWAKK